MAEPLVIATYHLRDYQHSDRPDRRRDELMEQVILDSEADIIAVQGLPGESALFRMALETRLDCRTHDGIPTIAAAGGVGLGILWRPGIRPVPGTWRPATDQPFRYGLTWLTLDVHGHRVTVANYHAPPAGEAHQAQREAELLTTALGHHEHNVFLGGTWPTTSDPEAERILPRRRVPRHRHHLRRALATHHRPPTRRPTPRPYPPPHRPSAPRPGTPTHRRRHHPRLGCLRPPTRRRRIPIRRSVERTVEVVEHIVKAIPIERVAS
ncbi:hypothetical protein GCM10027280_59690 [Micromonospora polyrhachis]|uniref:Endonuclease/exonuclease/phosphatase domain-containing protein n=1 Tax=Micromonospora polyrhachis TaxID=1282883 RepID=A0A7W7SUH6_9ACTN|nr:endonuclease/exonuclease/phosphatase family protein [Micromonospora polyrhachis]MBB4961225.1 hypothetical protein [Micromonospora polyrhachis]